MEIQGIPWYFRVVQGNLNSFNEIYVTSRKFRLIQINTKRYKTSK